MKRILYSGVGDGWQRQMGWWWAIKAGGERARGAKVWIKVEERKNG
jgi:hypothetical protein